MKGENTIYQLHFQNKYKITETANKRLRSIKLFDRYGKEPTEEAFGISLSSIYRWKKLLRELCGMLFSLNNASRAPYNKRKSIIDDRTIDFIRKLRKQ